MVSVGIFMCNNDGCSYCVLEGSDDVYKDVWVGYVCMIVVVEYI